MCCAPDAKSIAFLFSDYWFSIEKVVVPAVLPGRDISFLGMKTSKPVELSIAKQGAKVNCEGLTFAPQS